MTTPPDAKKDPATFKLGDNPNEYADDDAKPSLAKWKDFAVKVVQLKHEAGQLGMYRTMHALEPATQEAGWEIADRLARREP